ncbi:hypothetical protein CFP56_017920 [Quercus suber]|uniref:Uncharacterized protein n=1 Tax=Quercus suber TaxID=58331 RepID=A0AAW0KK42_QUESU
MGELLLLIKLSLTKVQVEIMMVTATVTEVVIVTEVVTMEVGVDLMVGSALSVGSLAILLGSVQVKALEAGAGMVVGMIGLVVVVAVGVGVMVLTEMEIGLVGAAGILVVVQVLEQIDTAVTVEVLMNAVVAEEVSALDRVTASDSALELVVPQLLSLKRSKFPFAGYILMKIVLVDSSSISVV